MKQDAYISKGLMRTKIKHDPMERRTQRRSYRQKLRLLTTMFVNAIPGA